MITARKAEILRRANRVVTIVLVVILVAFLINAAAAFLGRDKAHAATCPKGQDSISPDRYWADGDALSNWRLGEINLNVKACYGRDGKIKSSGADLFVRTNSVGTGLGYEIYRLPGNDYVDNIRHGLVKVYYLYFQYHQCLIPGPGLICNHTGTVRYEVTIYSPKAMHDLGQYAPRKRINWMWTPRNDWADNHFELFSTP